MTSVVSSLLAAVVVLSIAVDAAPAVPSAAASGATAYYYEPIVPYGPYPAPGYVVSTYVPQYTGYRLVTPVSYPPRKTDYDEDQYDKEEPKYYYGGKFNGVCSIDGLYYKDEKSFVVCSNGYASYQPCPPGTKTDKFPSYTAGYYYGSSDLCSMNLVDYGYSPHSYMPHVVSHDKKPQTSYEEKPVTYGSETPRKDTYPPSYSSYDSPKDPYPPPPSYDSSSSHDAHAGYPPETSYQLPVYHPPSTYAVDDQYPAPTHTGSYPPKKDVYPPPTDHVHSHSSYKPSPPSKPYPPPDTPSSYYAFGVQPADHKRETGTGYSDNDDH